MPSSRPTVRATSSMRVNGSRLYPLGGVDSQSRLALACCLVVPPPRFFGRRYSGLRTMRSRWPCTVSSTATSVPTSGGA